VFPAKKNEGLLGFLVLLCGSVWNNSENYVIAASGLMSRTFCSDDIIDFLVVVSSADISKSYMVNLPSI
jgi:hypothetical protein